MVRQRDDAFYENDAFSHLPLFDKLGCSNTTDCILNLARRYRLKLGPLSEFKTVLISKIPPTSAQCEELLEEGVLCSPADTSVYVQQALCEHASSIGYVDDMKKQVGLGGGMTTIYEVLREMGRNTSLDIGFSQLL
jgi:hypothetical protein